jgi:hypothetical protein
VAGEALQKNDELINVQQKAFLNKLRVKGILNPKKGEAKRWMPQSSSG